MSYRLCYILLIAVCLFNIGYSIPLLERLIRVLKCRDLTVNLKYPLSLPAAGSKPVTQYITDNGTFTECEAIGVTYVRVAYYLTLTLSDATCEKGVFTEFKMIGNFDIALSIPKGLFNFTVNLSDPTKTRYLNVPQKFDDPAALVNNLNTPLIANFTYRFPATKHQPGCRQVLSETVFVDADLYIGIPNQLINSKK